MIPIFLILWIQRPKFCMEVGNKVTILGQEAPTAKVLQVLDSHSALLKVFLELEGLPSHHDCCLFRGP